MEMNREALIPACPLMKGSVVKAGFPGVAHAYAGYRMFVTVRVCTPYLPEWSLDITL